MPSSRQSQRKRRQYLASFSDVSTDVLNHTNLQGVMPATTPNSEITHREPSHQMAKRQKTSTQTKPPTLKLASFPHFSELPVEIQILIWSFASNPEGPLHLTDRFIGTIYVNNPNHQPLEMRFFRHKPYFLFQLKPPTYELCVAQLAELARDPSNRSTNVTMARRALMGTSRLARQISLESWIKDVQGMHIGKSKTNSRVHVELYPEGKEAIVELLRVLIAHDGSKTGYGATNGFIEEEKEESNGRSGAPVKADETDDSKLGDGDKMAKNTRNSRRRKRKPNALKEQDGGNGDETLSQAKSSEGEASVRKKHVPAAVAWKHTKQKYSRGPAWTDIKNGESPPLHAFFRGQTRMKGTREYQL